MNILHKIILLIISLVLFIFAFGMFLPLLQFINILPHTGHAHGLGLGYIFLGALLGLIIGLIFSIEIIFKKTHLIKTFFIITISSTTFIAIILYVGVNFFHIHW